MFALFKWLLWCCLPSTLVLLGLASVAAWLFFRKQFRPALLIVLLEALLITPMLPYVSMQLGYSLERRYPPQTLASIPAADAIVVLGGGLGPVRPEVPYPECYSASDRILTAYRLWKAGKAPVIIPTGEMANVTEKVVLESLGVPASAILCEDRARDTAENASKTFSMLVQRKCKTVLVVTSSWHLPRTMMLFQMPGISFVPVSCDTEATLTRAQWAVMPLWQKLPSFQSAASSMVYVKEWLGILFYSFRRPQVKAAIPAVAAKNS